ncbi:MAG: L,D-transpeptidase family protein [Bacillota bacterium]|nr:L,D-transpeptidase family protein [Bacillota bacterium]
MMRSIFNRLTFILPVSFLLIILLGVSPGYVSARGKTNALAVGKYYSIIPINQISQSGDKSKTSVNLKPDQYMVAHNDTVLSISKKLGVTPSALKWANNQKLDIKEGKILQIPIRQNKPLKDIIKEKGINIKATPLEIHVNKTDHVLGIIINGALIKTYSVDIGDNGLGDKVARGDHKTPEGTFYITEKSVLNPEDEYLGTRWMRLSYPNAEDAERGLQNGIIDAETYKQIKDAISNKETPPQETGLGGSVGIHGGSKKEFGSDWTWGCVGLTNSSVEDFFNFVNIGTKVIIEK